MLTPSRRGESPPTGGGTAPEHVRVTSSPAVADRGNRHEGRTSSSKPSSSGRSSCAWRRHRAAIENLGQQVVIENREAPAPISAMKWSPGPIPMAPAEPTCWTGCRSLEGRRPDHQQPGTQAESRSRSNRQPLTCPLLEGLCCKTILRIRARKIDLKSGIKVQS